MVLRKATFNDWEILFNWRNDFITRKNSINQNKITKSNHKLWLSDSLMNEYREIYILEKNMIPVGTIRTDHIDINKYILSWNISPEHRGKGLGNMILELYLKNRKGEFLAEIKSSNIASIKIVEKNKFQLLNTKNDILTFVKLK